MAIYETGSVSTSSCLSNKGAWNCISHASCGTYGCAGEHRAACPSNRPISISAATGDTIAASAVNTLRNNLYNEIAVWRQHGYYTSFIYPSYSFNTNEDISVTKFNDLITSLNSTQHGTTGKINSATLITAVKLINDMLPIYNRLSVDCICNSYRVVYATCSCNGRHCTCVQY